MDPKDIVEIRIIPKYKAHYFEIEYVYELKNIKNHQLNENEALSIDLGIDNFASCLDTLGNPLIVYSKRVKSVNQWYNKENARLQRMKDIQGISRLTNRQVCLLRKRNNILRDFLNKTTHHIVQHCLDNGICKIVVGHNKGWKSKSKMVKQSNQKFVQIPHSLLIKKIESMCERHGIQFFRQEESCTSQSSFLDNDPLPTLEKEKPTFKGKRIHRGLYRTFQPILVNADLNGAANILRKYPHIRFDGQGG